MGIQRLAARDGAVPWGSGAVRDLSPGAEGELESWVPFPPPRAPACHPQKLGSLILKASAWAAAAFWGPEVNNIRDEVVAPGAVPMSLAQT